MPHIHDNDKTRPKSRAAANSPHFQQEGTASFIPPQFKATAGPVPQMKEKEEKTEEALQKKANNNNFAGGDAPASPSNPNENILATLQRKHNAYRPAPKQYKSYQLPKQKKQVQQPKEEEPSQLKESTANQKSQGGLPQEVQAKMENSMGHDFSNVNIHKDSQNATDAGALAYAQGNDVHFAPGQFKPNTTGGQELIGHELAHVVQQREGRVKPTKVLGKGMAVNDDPGLEKEADDMGKMAAQAKLVKPSKPNKTAKNASPIIQRTTGKDVKGKVDNITTQHDDLKKHTDVVKAALREIKKGISVATNKMLITKQRLSKIATLLKLDLTSLTTEWNWLVDNAAKSPKGYSGKETDFFSKITKSTLKSVRKDFPKSHAHDWIRNSNSAVFDLIIKHANADITAAQLYAYASNEGLSLLVKAHQDAGVGENDMVKRPVSGFQAFGLDDFMSDLDAKRMPASNFLPKGFKSKIKEETNVNEKGRAVRSATFPDWGTALQGKMAILKRKRALFKEDAKNNGYAAPTTKELVYWTYLYFNPGEFGGKAQLEKYKKGNKNKIKERKLGDWITKGEYNDAQRVLQGFQAVEKMGLFK